MFLPSLLGCWGKILFSLWLWGWRVDGRKVGRRHNWKVSVWHWNIKTSNKVWWILDGFWSILIASPVICVDVFSWILMDFCSLLIILQRFDNDHYYLVIILWLIVLWRCFSGCCCRWRRRETVCSTCFFFSLVFIPSMMILKFLFWFFLAQDLFYDDS